MRGPAHAPPRPRCSRASRAKACTESVRHDAGSRCHACTGCRSCARLCCRGTAAVVFRVRYCRSRNRTLSHCATHAQSFAITASLAVCCPSHALSIFSSRLILSRCSSHTRAHARIVSVSVRLAFSHSHTLSLTLSLTHTHTHSLSLTHTHAHTHTLSHALSPVGVCEQRSALFIACVCVCLCARSVLALDAPFALVVTCWLV